MSDPLDDLQRLVTRRGTKAQVIAESGGSLEEVRFAYATDTLELGVYTNGAWVWIGATALVVKDEGVTLTTAATTLDFVGSGVTASGTGATKTITISAGSGSSQHILLADGHATPFTFNDLLQMDSGADFMWSDPE